MEISETSKQHSEPNPNAKIEGTVWKPSKRTDEALICSDDLTWRTRGGTERSKGGGRRRSEKRESVSDLEAEETKGFMDLGFVFTEEDLHSELPEILPGLRTFLCAEEQNEKEPLVVPRPYLSEAWDFYYDKWSGRIEKDSMVIDFRMAKLRGDMNMKDNLKLWARSVASSLK
ncbi:hypothetical protein ISN45_Aa01g020840 [Arabidopsis thaliana x Arabidopsis arenosa]|uniref:Uncharacterized protein n=1 Tax=Arabidopsis thaliana x Arabidopsis arenosa TaxID=1240361 RepID=A0A8T2C1Z6_9BRAS|nr:hypothetical protein ISN45_Aa01g020840 [Arabidopsis thaliana x Arabidopsis arenosa]